MLYAANGEDGEDGEGVIEGVIEKMMEWMALERPNTIKNTWLL